jgi:hypothetical protein
MLTELTSDQKAMIPVYRDKAIEQGKCTAEAEWPAAEAALAQVLLCAGVGPVPIEKAVSPLAALRQGHKRAKAIDGVGGNALFQSPYYGGGVARNDFFVEVCGIELDPEKEARRRALSQFVKSCGGAYLHEKFAIIYDRPSIINIQTNTEGVGALHCEDGPALAWGRGPSGEYSPEAEGAYALYYWEGVEVPEPWIMDKPTTAEDMSLRAAEVLSSENQELLRAGCEILGWVPVLEALGMKVLDEDPNPMFGRLVSVDLPEAPDSRFLVAECGTGRTIAVPVSAEASTALEAGAMSYGVPVDLYRTLKVRT